jgi:hypothetical protein
MNDRPLHPEDRFMPPIAIDECLIPLDEVPAQAWMPRPASGRRQQQIRRAAEEVRHLLCDHAGDTYLFVAEIIERVLLERALAGEGGVRDE